MHQGDRWGLIKRNPHHPAGQQHPTVLFQTVLQRQPDFAIDRGRTVRDTDADRIAARNRQAHPVHLLGHVTGNLFRTAPNEGGAFRVGSAQNFLDR